VSGRREGPEVRISSGLLAWVALGWTPVRLQ
jgi:hypothetical protein